MHALMRSETKGRRGGTHEEEEGTDGGEQVWVSSFAANRFNEGTSKSCVFMH